MSANVIVETKQRIKRIEIDRADKKNALTHAMYASMADALVAADADAAVRVILIHGKPDCFTAGNDLKDFLERPPHAEGEGEAFRFIRTIAATKKPIVAAVGGAAVGIGTTMLLHCELVFASPDARFQLPFVSLATAKVSRCNRRSSASRTKASSCVRASSRSTQSSGTSAAFPAASFSGTVIFCGAVVSFHPTGILGNSNCRMS